MRSQEPRAAQNPAYRLTRIRFESLTKRHSAFPRRVFAQLADRRQLESGSFVAGSQQ
jgi:hypothetical protein